MEIIQLQNAVYALGNTQEINWVLVSNMLPGRSPRQCRWRWQNFSRPELRHDPLSPEELHTLIAQQKIFGNKWEKIARYLPGRSGNSLKNAFNTYRRQEKLLKRKRKDSDMAPNELNNKHKKISSKKRRINNYKNPVYTETSYSIFNDEQQFAEFIVHLDERFEDEDMANLRQSMASGNIMTEAEILQEWPDSVFSDF